MCRKSEYGHNTIVDASVNRPSGSPGIGKFRRKLNVNEISFLEDKQFKLQILWPISYLLNKLLNGLRNSHQCTPSLADLASVAR